MLDDDDDCADGRHRYWIHIADVDRWAPRGSELLKSGRLMVCGCMIRSYVGLWDLGTRVGSKLFASVAHPCGDTNMLLVKIGEAVMAVDIDRHLILVDG